MTPPVPLSRIFGASVYAAGSRVGVVSDVYVDPAGEYVVGLGVTGPNGRRWFLPWVAATVAADDVLASSPLVFMAVEQLGYYVTHGARLTENDGEGFSVDADGRLARRATDGAVSELLSEGTVGP